MLSLSKIKFIRSLAIKKFRDNHRQFTLEGVKMAGEAFERAPGLVVEVFATAAWLSQNQAKTGLLLCPVNRISECDLKKISTLTTPNQIMAIVRMPEYMPAIPGPDNLILALEGLQDPGNLGTVIRLASWFGIDSIICSPDTVDCFNPKTVQSSMGAVLSVRVAYQPLPDFLTLALNNHVPVYATAMHGEAVYTSSLTKGGIILLGNESQGLSREVLEFASRTLSIPSFSRVNPPIDSLNVATAAAVICAFFRKAYTY